MVLDTLADKVVYTGPIDAYFDYKLGTLEYRSVRFETETLDKSNFQGNAAVNYTDRETPWTRIIEHKWFEFGKDENGNDLPKTIISREYSSEWKPGDEPYYPVNDAKNGLLYSEYKKLADVEEKVIFGGRLGEYKYYDMDGGFVGMYELVVNDKVQRENINSINYFRDDKLVQQAISDMEKLMAARQQSKEQERSSTKKSVLDALHSLKAKKQEQPAQEQDKPKKAKTKGMEL